VIAALEVLPFLSMHWPAPTTDPYVCYWSKRHAARRKMTCLSPLPHWRLVTRSSESRPSALSEAPPSKFRSDSRQVGGAERLRNSEEMGGSRRPVINFYLLGPGTTPHRTEIQTVCKESLACRPILAMPDSYSRGSLIACRCIRSQKGNPLTLVPAGNAFLVQAMRARIGARGRVRRVQPRIGPWSLQVKNAVDGDSVQTPKA
jgi:hypothetical protein